MAAHARFDTSRPIAIGGRARSASYADGTARPTCPRAPVIGSMPAPSRLAESLPPLTLPASVDSSAPAGLATSFRDRGSLPARLAGLGLQSQASPPSVLGVLESAEFRVDLQRLRASSTASRDADVDADLEPHDDGASDADSAMFFGLGEAEDLDAEGL
mmetsp:Transcript_12852/g.38452  ORF Transcript_12852/g.38452 Transcript_12852/m.38452 type:complete len:159 (+) Transcript_12852:243-719(+)